MVFTLLCSCLQPQGATPSDGGALYGLSSKVPEALVSEDLPPVTGASLFAPLPPVLYSIVPSLACDTILQYYMGGA